MSEQDLEYEMCDGSCENHTGEVLEYKVHDPDTGYDWGVFTYCEAAVEEDRHRGFVLEAVE